MSLHTRMHMLHEEAVATTEIDPDCAEPASSAQSNPQPTIDALLDQRRQFLRFLERRVSSPSLAEDILQNAYLRALEHSSAIRKDESSTAWFYRVLRNAVIDHYRHRQVEDRVFNQWAAELETEVAPNDLTHNLVCQCIARALPSLTPAYAQILGEVDLAESSLAAFASAHNITQQNATVRIHRARKALRQRLTETCGACSAHGCLDCNCTT
jgi:RNA polymerase sigma factor (sigma-70 family)